MPLGRKCTVENRVINVQVKWFGDKSMKMRVGRRENASLLWEIMRSWGRAYLAAPLLGN